MFSSQKRRALSVLAEEILAMDSRNGIAPFAFEAYERIANKDVPPLKLADNIDNWIKDAAAKELSIRKFLGERDILTVPDWIQHSSSVRCPNIFVRFRTLARWLTSHRHHVCKTTLPLCYEPSPKAGYF